MDLFASSCKQLEWNIHNIDTRLDSGINPKGELLLKRDNHTHQNDEVKIAEEFGRFLGLEISMVNPRESNKN